jgi:hypothetical protein
MWKKFMATLPKVVQILTMSADAPESVIPYNFIYVFIWACLCVTMTLVAVFYIPYHLENSRQNSAAIKAGEVNSNSNRGAVANLKKLLVVFSSFFCFHVAIISYNMSSDAEENRKLFPVYISTGMPTLVLLLFTLEADIGRYLVRTVADKTARLQTVRRSGRVSESP